MESAEREKLLKGAKTEEDRLFVAKLLDKAERADRGYLTFTHFMDPHQRAIAKRILRDIGKPVIFEGGYADAERVVGLFLPDYLSFDYPGDHTSNSPPTEILKELRSNPEYPLSLLQVVYKKNTYAKELTHRDYLGALMNLGVKRETLGDILIHDDFAQVIVLSDVAPYLENNLTQVGRVSVEVQSSDLSQLLLPQVKTEEKTATVASLRLDAIVAEGFKLSRSQASEYIEAGKVYLQFEECTNGAKAVEEGSTISLRGMGRIILDKVGGNSKKNRIFVTLRRMV